MKNEEKSSAPPGASGSEREQVARADWVWMPHAAHLIVGHDCRFHLATVIGGHLISTVGEYLPDSAVREIFAQSRGVTLEGRGDARLADFMRKIGYEEIGLGRTYETMVFRAAPSKEPCCPWVQESGSDLDFEGYSDAGAAYAGHLAMCAKWAALSDPDHRPPAEGEKVVEQSVSGEEK